MKRLRAFIQIKSAALGIPLILLLAACGGGGQQGGFQMPPPQVSVASVLQKEVTAWDEFSGRIAAVENVEIRSRVAGYLDRIAFHEGANVKKGDLLFVIDPRPFEAELSRARAELASASTAAALASGERERADKLLAARAISAEEYQQRLSAEKTAEAAIAVAEAAVRTAQLNLSYARIESPINGRIGASSLRIGNLVDAGVLLTTVVSQDPVYVYFDGDEQAYLRYRQASGKDSKNLPDDSNPVFVGLSNEADYPHSGHLDFIDNQLDPTSGTIKMRAVVTNANGKLTPGMFARVRLLNNETRSALLIDDKAVLTDQDRKYVYTLGPENVATRKDVKLGTMIEGLRVVESGLTTEDKVIVHGVAKIFFPGMTVMPVEIGMGDPPPAPSTAPAASDASAPPANRH